MSNRKIRMLRLMEILRQETDEQNPMLASEICRKLSDMGISCDRRTLSRDIQLLNEQGYEVMSVMASHEKAYYIEDRSFSVPELKILIDAVQAASFVTERKTSELTEKIASLGGSHRADILKGNMVCFNTRKHRNESIYYNVGCLEEAIEQKKKATFRYYDLNTDGQRVYRRDGQLYEVEPVALVFNEDNYYLMTYSVRYDKTVNYRVDRMDRVKLSQEEICEKAFELRQSVVGYTEQVFKMYSGKTEQVTIRFSNKLIGSVYDKFGEETKMIPIGEDESIATVQVQISPTFWGWVFQFGNQMKIMSPDSVIDEYKSRVEELKANI